MPEKDLPQQQRYAQSLRCLQKSNYSITYMCVPIILSPEVDPIDIKENSGSEEEEEIQQQRQMNKVLFPNIIHYLKLLYVIC